MSWSKVWLYFLLLTSLISSKRSITLATIHLCCITLNLSINRIYSLPDRALWSHLFLIRYTLADLMASLNVINIISSTYRQDIAGPGTSAARLYCGPPARPLLCQGVRSSLGQRDWHTVGCHRVMRLLPHAVVGVLGVSVVYPSLLPLVRVVLRASPLLCCLKIRDLGFFIFSPPCNLLQSAKLPRFILWWKEVAWLPVLLPEGLF